MSNCLTCRYRTWVHEYECNICNKRMRMPFYEIDADPVECNKFAPGCEYRDEYVFCDGEWLEIEHCHSSEKIIPIVKRDMKVDLDSIDISREMDIIKRWCEKHSVKYDPNMFKEEE